MSTTTPTTLRAWAACRTRGRTTGTCSQTACTPTAMTMRTPSRCARGANGRLTSATWGTLAYGFTYNGLGDRLRQAVGGAPTNYSLDLVGGLTQVLSDGTNAYLYGNGRIGEDQPGGWQYHLIDALGSVRQLVDTTVGVALSRDYGPLGAPLLTTGSGSTVFGFTVEQRDGTGLVYLRARYYAPPFGRFLSRDIWQGDPRQPMSYNAWAYVDANPVNTTDRSGMCPDDDRDGRCDPWWLHCRMISDPELFEQCVECHTPTAPPPRLSPSENCERFVASWEGCVLRLYNDDPDNPDEGNCTIGIGELVHVYPCDGRSSEWRFRSGITEETAWAMFRSDLWEAASGVRTHVQVPLTQYQFDALVSFTFNLGVDPFAASIVLQTLNEGDYGSVPEAITHYIRSGENYPPGLTHRRRGEADMFARGIYPEVEPPVCTSRPWW